MPSKLNIESEKIRDRILYVMYLYLSYDEKNTRASFAELIGTNKGSINRWEYAKGSRYPTLDNLINCCRVFPEYAQWIVFGGIKKPIPDDQAKFNKLARQMKRLRALSKY